MNRYRNTKGNKDIALKTIPVDVSFRGTPNHKR